MHIESVEGAVWHGVYSVSILYLRCVSIDATTDAAEYTAGFNSLFEMRDILLYAVQVLETNYVSILYLRCSGRRVLVVFRNWPFRFNSLFEMHKVVDLGACCEDDPVSILYLRCTSPADASSQ